MKRWRCADGNGGVMVVDSHGEYVLHSDHLAAMDLAYKQHIENAHNNYAKGRAEALEQCADQLHYCFDNSDAFKDWLYLKIGLDYKPKDPYRDESGP